MRTIGLPEILVILGFLALISLALFFVFSTLRWRQQFSLQRALIEKFSSAGDFVEFVRTQAGQRFLGELSGGMTSPAGSILASIQRGVVIGFLGIGLLVVHFVFGGPLAPAGVGLLLVFLGAGFLISAVISYWLSKAWQLLGDSSGTKLRSDS
jgi:hypothetical protein